MEVEDHLKYLRPFFLLSRDMNVMCVWKSFEDATKRLKNYFDASISVDASKGNLIFSRH